MDRSIRGGPQARAEVVQGPGSTLNLPSGLAHESQNNGAQPTQTRNQYFQSPGGATSGYAPSMLSGMGGGQQPMTSSYDNGFSNQNHNSNRNQIGGNYNQNMGKQGGNHGLSSHGGLPPQGGSRNQLHPNQFNQVPFDDGGSILGPSASQIGQPNMMNSLQNMGGGQSQIGGFGQSNQGQTASPQRRTVGFVSNTSFVDGSSSGIFKGPLIKLDGKF